MQKSVAAEKNQGARGVNLRGPTPRNIYGSPRASGLSFPSLQAVVTGPNRFGFEVGEEILFHSVPHGIGDTVRVDDRIAYPLLPGGSRDWFEIIGGMAG